MSTSEDQLQKQWEAAIRKSMEHPAAPPVDEEQQRWERMFDQMGIQKGKTGETKPGFYQKHVQPHLPGLPGWQTALQTGGMIAGGALGEGVASVPLAALGGAAGEAVYQLSQHIRASPEAPKTSSEAAGQMGLAGAWGAAGELIPKGVGRLMPSRALTPTQELGREFSVRMSPAQQSQGRLMARIESILRRTLTGGGPFEKLDRAANQDLIRAGGDIAKEISGVRFSSPAQAGAAVQEILRQADETVADQYAEAVNPIRQLPVLLDVGDILPTARAVLGELKGPTALAPGLRSVESLNKAINILDDFAKLETEVPVTKVVGVQTPEHMVYPPPTVPGRPGMPPPVSPGVRVPATVKPYSGKAVEGIPVAKPVSISQAIQLRTLLFKISNSGEVDIGKGALGRLNSALDNAIQKALQTSGRAQEAQTFRSVSSKFRAVQDLLENTVMRRVAQSETPEAVASILLQHPETGFAIFKQLAQEQPGLRSAVERGIWEHLFDQATARGVAVRGGLSGELDKLGPAALQEIFGTRLAKVQRFANLIDTINLSPAIERPTSAQTASVWATGELGAISGTVFGAAMNMLGGGGAETALGGAVGLGAGLGSPYVLAKIMTRPGMVDIMTRAAQTPRWSAAGAKLLVQIMSATIPRRPRTPGGMPQATQISP